MSNALWQMSANAGSVEWQYVQHGSSVGGVGWKVCVKTSKVDVCTGLGSPSRGKNATWLFGRLSCVEFNHIWNNRHESVIICVPVMTSMKKFQISARSLQARKTQFWGFGWGACKCHNFRRWESFHGLANIPRMCLFYVIFDGRRAFSCSDPKIQLFSGRYDPQKTAKFSRWQNDDDVTQSQSLEGSSCSTHSEHTNWQFN